MLKKLSLATLVAMGSMSVASATDLSEAIQGVNLKGALRIRLYNETPEKGDSYRKWRTNAAFIFAVPVTDDLKLVDRVSTETYYKENDVAGTVGTVNSGLADNVLFAKYSKNGLTVLAGKIPVATPVTDTDLFGPPSHGAGVLATYKINDSLTVAAAGIDALVATDAVAVGANNTLAAAVIYNSDIADVQAWGFNVDNIIDSDIVISADIKALKDMGVKVHVDYATAELASNVATTLGKAAADVVAAGNKVDKTQSYFNVNADYKLGEIAVKVGYAMTGKDGGVVVLDGDSAISAVASTHQAYTIANTGDNTMMYAKLGYNVDEKTNAYVAYTTQDTDSVNEIEAGASFKYTKKFTLSAYYSMMTNDNGDNNEARAEAIYKF